MLHGWMKMADRGIGKSFESVPDPGDGAEEGAETRVLAIG